MYLVSTVIPRRGLFVKCIFYSTLVFMLLVLLLSTTHINPRHILQRMKFKRIEGMESSKDLKYILQWTSSKTVPFVDMGVGRSGFVQRKCPHTNCYVTDNRELLGDYTKFDVIAFAGPEVVRLPEKLLPQKRSPHQKYVFASIESAFYYPVCDEHLNGFFNWTWTYKLDSDARWGYVVVRDEDNKVIGPNKDMHWMKLEDMNPVSEEFKDTLRSKSKAAAWFASNCNTLSHRENFVRALQEYLNQYDLAVDIYGRCGSNICSRNNMADCLKMVDHEYYFYFAFENSLSEDYVTEKLIYGLQNNAVPIVFGGANYTRFMPDGMYINARELGVEKLADTIYEIINEPEKYINFFRWKNHYSYHSRADSVETNDYCRFCAMLNDDKLMNKMTVYEEFSTWWTPLLAC